MREIRPVPQGKALFALYLQKEPDGNIRGSFLPENGGKSVTFASLSRMVLLMEEAMDVPQESGERPIVQTPDFEVEILFRRNSTWQGILRRPGFRDGQNFRSVLELLTLMESNMAV